MASQKMQSIWLEKYRPSNLEGVLGNPDIVEQFKSIVQDGSIPNMILSGPPGCGKTSSILCIAKQIYGDRFRDAVIELNASDERGLDVIRTKVKQFAEKLVKLPEGQQKLVILDEADSLTPSAQQALRMIISDYSNTTRFAFSCNNSHKIIEPIQSRCIILRFSKLSNEDIAERLVHVLEQEKVLYDKSGIEALIYTSEGDMRTAINNLQATAVGNKIVNEETVFAVCDVPDITTIKTIVTACHEHKRHVAIEGVQKLWDESFTAFEIVNNIGKLIENENYNVEILMRFIDEVGMAKLAISKGLDTLLQVLAFVMKLCNISQELSKSRQIRRC